MPNVRSFVVLPSLPEPLRELDFIARNMFWSWNPEFIGLFRRIDSDLWKACGHNPIRLLGTVSQERLEALAENRGFVSELGRAAEKLRSYLQGPPLSQAAPSKDTKPLIAYFSAEFGIHECLPIYAGGLGILAGDHLKSASDLYIDLVGVSLLYQAYYRQYLNVDGWQQEVYVETDSYSMPMELVRQKDGQPLTIGVEYPGRVVQAQIWSVAVGRVKLYLLDPNIPANAPQDRAITGSIYDGDRETRIRQEIMLGIGGMRALTAMGISPTVCHLNEGHAAFVILERIRQLCQTVGASFNEALEAVKAGNVFTIHTPVKAGSEEFPPEMMDKYFTDYLPALGISRDEFLGLGRVNPRDDKESFKMPVLAIRLSAYRNGVSKLHGQVSRRMWAGLCWPDVPVEEVPITSITNGIHIKSWLSAEMDSLYERYLGPTWAEQSADESVWKNIDQIPDEEFWRVRQRCKENLVVFARRRLKEQIQRRGTYHTELNWAEEVLDPEALTIGFARRFAPYKRGNLLLKDPKRIVKLLSDTARPLQIIFAGKAHPRDTEGKEIIRQIIHFASQYQVRRRIVFIEDYDINVARALVRGVDIWLNNPRRPMEASGTSGMKAAVNGALSMSTLDGWWCEGYKPEIGWAIGSGESYEDVGYQDMVESQAIYNMLENEAVPLFYTRSADNLPRAWIRRVKNSIKWISPRFSTHRMVTEYISRFYTPASGKWSYLMAENMSKAKELAKWKSNMKAAWREIAVSAVDIELDNGEQRVQFDPRQSQLRVGSQLDIRALVKLGKIKPNEVSVELYYGAVDTWGDIKDGSALRMNHKEVSAQNGEHWFAGAMSCRKSGRQGLALRILPRHDDIIDPYELGLILWEGVK
jgi:starch phosphorylase